MRTYRTLAVTVLLFPLLTLLVEAQPSDLQCIPSSGTVSYSDYAINVGLALWNAIPTTELLDQLHCEWGWGGGCWLDPEYTTKYDTWFSAGLDPHKQFVEVMRVNVDRPDHAAVMTCLNAALQNHANYGFYGFYLNDYRSQIVNYGRTRPQWEEIVNTIRGADPTLKIIIPWTHWTEIDPNIDEYLSWIEFDEVLCNYYVMHGEHELEDCDGFHIRAVAKFVDRPIWATANIRGKDSAGNYYFTTETEYKHIVNVLENHYDAGDLDGIRVQSLLNIIDHPEYATWTGEVLFGP